MRTEPDKTAQTLALALGVALLPPIWAVLSPFVGVSVAPVALICAGVYAAAKNIFPMLFGFWLGDLWSLLALWSLENLPLPENPKLFITLFVLGAIAVLLDSVLPVHLAAHLSGWAICLTVLSEGGLAGAGTLPFQLAGAMAVGVLYVGWGVDTFQHLVAGRLRRRR